MKATRNNCESYTIELDNGKLCICGLRPIKSLHSNTPPTCAAPILATPLRRSVRLKNKVQVVLILKSQSLFRKRLQVSKTYFSHLKATPEFFMNSPRASSGKTTTACIVLLLLVFATSFLVVIFIRDLVLKDIFPNPDKSNLKEK